MWINRRLSRCLLGLILVLLMCTSCSAAAEAAANGNFYTAFVLLFYGGGY